MKLFPAIDLRGGKVVRLFKGDFDAETIYESDPVGVAQSFVNAGAEWIHIVDLDAAKTGEAINRPLISKVVKSVGVPVQSGGGVRDRESAEALLATGVRRIVLGTVAIEKPELVVELAKAHPGRIAVGLDARGGEVAARGWLESSNVTVIDLVKRYGDSGVDAFVVTDIDRDGTLVGPDVEGLLTVLQSTHVDVIASGGVGKIEDLRTLADVEVDGKKLAGAIVGKAIYEGAFSVSDAVKACS